MNAVRPIPELKPITAKVADVTDERLFPNIAEARRHAAALRDDPVGRDLTLVENG